MVEQWSGGKPRTHRRETRPITVCEGWPGGGGGSQEARPYRGKVHVHDVAKLTLGKVRDAGLPRGRHAVSKHSHEAHTAHVQRQRELPRRLTLGSALVSTHSWSRLYLKSEGKPGVAGKLRHAAPHRRDLARFRSRAARARARALWSGGWGLGAPEKLREASAAMAYTVARAI